MTNRNEDEGSFHGHGLNRNNQYSEFNRWPPGMSFTEAMFGPQTHLNEGLQQWHTESRGGSYSAELSRNLRSGEFMPRYSQSPIATTSHAMERQHNSEPFHPNPQSQSEDRSHSNFRGGNWSIAEDEKLCHAWVRVSTDPITGDSQKKLTFWRRVFDDFVKQHGENEQVTRNQKACDQRFQHIRAECNKWSAALKKVNEHPRSGQNAQDAERATHVYYRGQNNGKCFKLDHCWEILRNCAKYNDTHRQKSIILASDEFQCDRASNEGVHEDSPAPTIGKRPPGRKASKEKVSTKRQKSQDAQSSIGDRIAKSIDDLHASSSAQWERSHLLNVEEQQMGIKYRRMQMIRERIVVEKELMGVDISLYKADSSLIGSPSDAKKWLLMRQAKIEELTAEIDDTAEELVPIQTSRNLNQSFNDEADNRSC